MAITERGFVLLAFLLVGCVVGYVTFLIFRIAVRQTKFEWSGALAVISSLAGGGFLSYRSQPLNFAAYGVGFFAGFAMYWKLLQSEGGDGGYIRGSASTYQDAAPIPLTLGSQAASGSSVGEPPPHRNARRIFSTRLQTPASLPSDECEH